MAEDSRITKVEILIQQEKFAEAQSILTELLSGDANNIQLLSLLAEVKLRKGEYNEAETITDRAIGLSPDTPDLFYIKSRIAIQQERLTDAELHITQAISLYSYDADYFAILAHIKLARKQFNEALESADRALEIDAENLAALNARSTALVKLNRKEESFETIEGALREDPNNAYTHANYGWSLLERGDHKKALIHFKESLSNDPNLEYAQAGMMEALKAGNFVYRIFLRYSFWMSNLSAKYQWSVLIGFYFGVRALRGLAKNNEAMQPYLNPLIVLLVLIAFSTWVIGPVSNLFLRFNKYGKVLLDKKEKMSTNFVGLSFLVFVLGILFYLFTKEESMLAVAVFGFVMMVPLGTMFSPAKNKYGLLIYTIALALVGVLAIVQTASTTEIFNYFTVVFMLGFFAFQWVANYMLIKEDNL